MNMGRTKRKRRKIRGETFSREDWSNMIDLQKSLKVKCGNLRIGRFGETGRGMRCNRRVKEGDVLICLPLESLITARSPSHVFSMLENNENEPQVDLTVFLVYESHLKENSKYFNYIELLPRSHSNLFFSTSNEIELLPDFVREPVIEQREKLEKIYMKLRKNLKGLECDHCGQFLTNIYSRENFQWAWFTVNTRSVYYKEENEEKQSMALAPILDMLNHSSRANTQMIIDYEKKLYILKTLIEFKRFKEAFIQYGPHSNLTLLLEYGFITPDNPFDFVKFNFNDVLTSAKTLNPMFGEISKSKYSFIVNNNLDKNLMRNSEDFSWNLNALLYTLITRDENVSRLQAKAYSNNFIASEKATMDLVKKILISNKCSELERALLEMKKIPNPTSGFECAKNLLNVYIDLLQRDSKS